MDELGSSGVRRRPSGRPGVARRGGRYAACAMLLGAVAPCVAAAADNGAWRYSSVQGADGVSLNVVEAGDRGRPTLVLIHGIGQSHLIWENQLRAPLAARYHVVAYDLRGHGNSGKPVEREAYADTRKWADDLQSVLAATAAGPAVVVGWSYGTIVISDYVRHHGTRALAGIALIASDGGLSAPRPPLTGPVADMLKAMHRRQASPDLRSNMDAARELAKLLTKDPMPAQWIDRAAMVSMRVPASVWDHLRAHPMRNQDLGGRIDVPTLLMIGRYDGGTPEASTRELASQLAAASVRVFESSGHSPFVEETALFDDTLARFADAAHSTRERDPDNAPTATGAN